MAKTTVINRFEGTLFFLSNVVSLMKQVNLTIKSCSESLNSSPSLANGGQTIFDDHSGAVRGSRFDTCHGLVWNYIIFKLPQGPYHFLKTVLL